MSKISVVLFDLDNTLIDFLRMKTVSCQEAIAAMIAAGLPMKQHLAMEKLFALYDKYGWEHQTIFQTFLKEATGKIDYKILASGIVAYRRVKVSYVEAYPNVMPTLIALKAQGLKLGVISDAPRLSAWIRLVSMKLADFFDVVITFDDTKQRKPSMLPFKAALEKLNVKPGECLMVGDWVERDIVGAKRIGMKTCYAKYGAMKTVKRSGADYEIDDIKRLSSVVGDTT
ncbi:TIGR02253 family HAD-type hydrolase [Candidatus Woesearchaeota archaeon]|nr:TIGR02253 family HAD-type hydrolase [Candidatus Woesearchaeota archaeon]